jgi:hypothetical protein
MDKDDFFTRTQIEIEYRRINQLINSDIFNNPTLKIFQESVFTEILIKLNDLLQKLKTFEKRIDFTDDIEVGKDITDLVSKIRNAVCHMTSNEHMLKNEEQPKKLTKFTFNIMYGNGSLANINGKTFKSDYPDDICFFFGENKIYLKRHLIRCINEAGTKIQELYPR